MIQTDIKLVEFGGNLRLRVSRVRKNLRKKRYIKKQFI